MSILGTVNVTWTECNRVEEICTPAEIREAKAILKNRGWTYRSVAPVLGIGFVHLSRVLNGQRQSRRLLAAISALPITPKNKGVK